MKSNTTIVSNVLTSPDGTINADNLKDTASNTIHRLRNGVTLLANTDYTISIFAKKGTLSNIQLALINTADSKIASRVFDLENGTLGEELTSAGGTLQNSEIKDYGNGWYRCSITAQLTTTPNQSQITLAPLSSGNTQIANQVTYTGDGTGTVSIWGAMLEALSYPTSLIPTEGSQVTRNQDLCNNGGSLASINSTSGTLYAEIASLTKINPSGNITLTDGTGNNRIYIYYLIDNSISVIYNVNSTGASINNFSLANITDQTKIAVRWGNSNVSVWINGASVLSNTTSNFLPNTLNVLSFAKPSGGVPFEGKTKALAVWKETLSDQELTELTTI